MDEPVLNLEGVVLSPQKELVRMFYKEMWDRADKSLIPSIFHPDFAFRGSLGPSLVGHGQFADIKLEIEPRGRIFSWERVWHPSHKALREHGPYLAVLVEIAHAGGVRLVGNLLGDPMQAVTIGTDVEGVFEHHSDSNPPYTLLQWRSC